MSDEIRTAIQQTIAAYGEFNRRKTGPSKQSLEREILHLAEILEHEQAAA